MVSLLSRGVGVFVKSLAEFNCTQATRCSSLTSGISSWQCLTARWFSNSTTTDGRPKKPLTAYFRFTVQQRPKFLKQYPDTKLVDVTRKIAQEWRELPVTLREPYVTAANADLQKYKEDFKKYKEKLTPHEIEIQREERRTKLAKKKSIRRKRELTVFGRPKRPRSAFNIFMSENFQEAKGTTIQSKMKSLRDDWERVHKTQRQTYIQLAEDDKIRYENEITSWEEQMVDLGREDLIRRKKLKKHSAVRERKVVTQRKTNMKKLKKTLTPKEGKKTSTRASKHEE
ncbi:transcription factor A, mitochondrial [Discoglossus pictus]